MSDAVVAVLQEHKEQERVTARWQESIDAEYAFKPNINVISARLASASAGGTNCFDRLSVQRAVDTADSEMAALSGCTFAPRINRDREAVAKAALAAAADDDVNRTTAELNLTMTRADHLLRLAERQEAAALARRAVSWWHLSGVSSLEKTIEARCAVRSPAIPRAFKRETDARAFKRETDALVFEHEADPPLLHRICSNPGCPFICTDRAVGYCCRACAATPGVHGPRCERRYLRCADPMCDFLCTGVAGAESFCCRSCRKGRGHGPLCRRLHAKLEENEQRAVVQDSQLRALMARIHEMEGRRGVAEEGAAPRHGHECAIVEEAGRFKIRLREESAPQPLPPSTAIAEKSGGARHTVARAIVRLGLEQLEPHLEPPRAPVAADAAPDGAAETMTRHAKGDVLDASDVRSLEQARGEISRLRRVVAARDEAGLQAASKKLREAPEQDSAMSQDMAMLLLHQTAQRRLDRPAVRPTSRLLASDVMMPIEARRRPVRPSKLVRPEDTMEHAHNLMQHMQRKGVAVADDDGTLIGTLNLRDAIKAAETGRAHQHVKVWMRRQVPTVRPNMPFDELSLFLIERSIGCVPVVDERGQLLGLITRADVLRQRGLSTTL